MQIALIPDWVSENVHVPWHVTNHVTNTSSEIGDGFPDRDFQSNAPWTSASRILPHPAIHGYSIGDQMLSCWLLLVSRGCSHGYNDPMDNMCCSFLMPGPRQQGTKAMTRRRIARRFPQPVHGLASIVGWRSSFPHRHYNTDRRQVDIGSTSGLSRLVQTPMPMSGFTLSHGINSAYRLQDCKELPPFAK